jgi:hypothetical protein
MFLYVLVVIKLIYVFLEIYFFVCCEKYESEQCNVMSEHKPHTRRVWCEKKNEF